MTSSSSFVERQKPTDLETLVEGVTNSVSGALFNLKCANGNGYCRYTPASVTPMFERAVLLQIAHNAGIEVPKQKSAIIGNINEALQYGYAFHTVNGSGGDVDYTATLESALVGVVGKPSQQRAR